MPSWLKKHEHDKAVAAWAAADQAWSAEQERLQSLVAAARSFGGLTRIDDPSIPVELRKDERAFFVGRGAALIEPRRLPGHWQGGYSGFSFRVAKGVRWHVGGTRGHYVPGAELPTPVDQGVVTITDQRVVFQGARQSREWLYAKLLGYQHDPTQPWTAIQVSNRQKTSGVLYDRAHAETFHFQLALALAVYNGDRAGFEKQLEAQAATHRSERPLPPPPLPESASAT